MQALRWASPPGLRAGSPGVCAPADLCKIFFLKCSAPQLLKRVRDLRVRTKWGCVAQLLIGKPFFPTEVAFGRLWRASFKGDVHFLIEFDFLPRSLCPHSL